MPAYKRADILLKTAALLREHTGDLAKIIAGEEVKRLHGETIPLGAAPSGRDYFGYGRLRRRVANHRLTRGQDHLARGGRPRS